MAHIHFDYSKVAPFVNEHELGYMQSQVTAADKLLREGTGAVAISEDGSTYLRTTTKKNLLVSKPLLRKSNLILKSLWSSVSVVLI